MFPKILLVLALLVANTISAPMQGGEAVGELPEEILIPPRYQLLVAQDPVNANVFHIWAPNEVTTPVRAEVVVGSGLPWLSDRHFKIEKLEGFVGPFEWRPAFPDGWGLSITFDDIPSVVVIAVVVWDGKAPRLGCGYWIGPQPISGEVFLPSIFADK